MDRREFLKSAAAGVGLAASSVGLAQNSFLGVAPNGMAIKRAWVSHPKLVLQNCPAWCWAASISMMFRSMNHPVDQVRIVTETYGSTAPCWTAMPLTVAQDLNREWIDDNNHKFSSTLTAAYDYLNGIVAITNGFIVDSLSQDRPLLYGNTHHAMLLVTVDYLDTPLGPNILSAGVFDPWPKSAGFHLLSPSEVGAAHLGGQMTFLAAVNLADLAPDPEPNSDESD